MRKSRKYKEWAHGSSAHKAGARCHLFSTFTMLYNSIFLTHNFFSRCIGANVQLSRL